MKKEDKEYIVKHITYRSLGFMDSRDAQKIAEKMLPAVVKDINETADPENWNYNDIDIAVKRVLLKKFRIEE